MLNIGYLMKVQGEMQHFIKVLDSNGHSNITWKEDDTTTQEIVDQRFQELIKSHILYDVTDGTNNPKPSIKFNPNHDYVAAFPTAAG